MRGALALITLVLAGCPVTGPDNSRTVDFTVQLDVDQDGPPVREPRTLTVQERDARELGLESPEIRSDFGIFVIATSIEVDGDASYEYCLHGAAVIEDDRTGAEAARVPAGTCLVEGEPVDVG